MKNLVLLVLITVVPAVGIENYNFEYDIKIDSVPASVVSDVLKSSSETLDYLKYFPMFRKTKYEYEYESTNFAGKPKIIVEIKNYSKKDVIATASVSYYYNKKDVKTTDYYIRIGYSVRIGEKGIFSRDIISGVERLEIPAERLEIPIPLLKDKEWTDTGVQNKVIGFSSKVIINNTTYNNCMKIVGNMANGKSERYYAPNIGLIKEVLTSVDRTDIIRLVKYEISK